MAFNINAGELNKKITFAEQIEIENSLEETVHIKQKYKTVWAKLAPIRGRDYYDAERIKFEYTHTVIIRYLKDITENMQIQYKNRIFDIVSIINPNEADKLLEIKCKEVIT